MPRDKVADADILKDARERFELIQSSDQDNRDNYKADLAFVYTPGAQWPDDVRTLRRGWQEPCLEFNQLKQFVAQVVNDQLQNRPGVRVHAAGGDASEEVAEILQGMIRAIEYDSKADDVYKNSFKLAVAGGRGWCRIVSEFESNDDPSAAMGNQKLVIKPIQDSNTVYASNDYEQPDGSDRPDLFVVAGYDKGEFERKWPKADPISWDDIPSGWTDGKDRLFVADYYKRICTTRAAVLMTDGAFGWLDEMPPKDEWPDGVSIKLQRDIEAYSVKWYTLAGGQQVLEEHEWPGSIIPVVQCAGEDIILEGRRVFQGLIRHARDAQSLLNYSMTQQAIQLALSPRAPWTIAEGQIEGYESVWRDANTKNFSALVYKPTTIAGLLVPPPQRTQPAMFSEGWDRQAQLAIGMVKSTIGMYEQSLGQKGNEVSGKAITAREKQGDTATFNFVNNWHMMIDLVGRILVDVMPVFYDTERIVSTIGLDDTKKLVTINQNTTNVDQAGALTAIKKNDITKGKYAVVVEAGPSFATKRIEGSEAMQGIIQSFPEVMQFAGDIAFKSLDVADADALAERWRMTAPPAIQQAIQAKEGGKQPPDPAIMAQMQQQQAHLDQAAQTMQAMEQELNKAKSGVEAKMQVAQLDAQAKERQAQMDAEAQERQAHRDAVLAESKAQIEAQSKEKLALIDRQTALDKAATERQTAIDLAIISRATQLELGAMQQTTDMAQIASDAEAEAKRAEQAEDTATVGHDAVSGEV